MKNNYFEKQFNSFKSVIDHKSFETFVVPSANEALLQMNSSESVWPEEVRNNVAIKEQVLERKDAINSLDILLSQEPNLESYETISNFLKNHPRLLLYLPFDILDSDLAKQSKFTETYLEQWHQLLSDHDLREDFSEGDILEPGLQKRDLPQVVKAAHLAPVLIEKNIINIDHLQDLLKNSHDSILRESLADAISATADFGLLSDSDIEKILASDDSLLHNLAIIILDKKSHSEKPSEEKTFDQESFDKLPRLVNDELLEIDKKYQENEDGLSSARIVWQKQRDIDNLLNSQARELSSALRDKKIELNQVQELISSAYEKPLTMVGVLAVREYIENLASSNPEKATEVCDILTSNLEKLTDNSDSDLRDLLDSTKSRLGALGLINEVKNNKVDIKTELNESLRSIESNEQLMKHLYPALVVYGSKIKGYGGANSDLDMAVFIRPETNISEREELKKLLKQSLPNDQVLEFWLKKHGENLSVIDFANFDNKLGDSSSVNVLFNGTWGGEKKAINDLFEKLLSSYFETTLDKNLKYNKVLERDALQYRLMHKGYHKLYPPVNSLKEKTSDAIDFASAFWDEGYRRLASKLYLQKVFLPNTDKK